MTRDIEVLTAWLLIVVVIAALSTTAVPIIYSFAPWRSTPLGRRFMIQAVSFAAALDMTVLFQFWHPDILVIFWIQAIIFTTIAASTSAIAWQVWRFRHPRKGKNEDVAE